jgi:AcrR family transcriptional regulator
MPTHSERKEKTCAQIISVAWEIFARDGFAKAALAEIVKDAGVTTGTIYHHFGGKKELLVAVAEHVEQCILEELISLSPQSDSNFESLEAGILNTLEICSRPNIQRIVFLEAPNVIGVSEWRKIEINYGYGIMQQSIAALAESGEINAPNTDLTTRLLLGAVMEAAQEIAVAQNPSLALVQAKETLQAMLTSLKRN